MIYKKKYAGLEEVWSWWEKGEKNLNLYYSELLCPHPFSCSGCLPLHRPTDKGRGLLGRHQHDPYNRFRRNISMTFRFSNGHGPFVTRVRLIVKVVVGCRWSAQSVRRGREGGDIGTCPEYRQRRGQVTFGTFFDPITAIFGLDLCILTNGQFSVHNNYSLYNNLSWEKTEVCRIPAW